MRSSFGPLCLVPYIPRLWFVLVFLLHAAGAAAEGTSDGARLLARTRSDPLNVPIQTPQARSPADNTTFGAGLSTVSLSSERESYYTIIEAGGLNFRVVLDTASSDLWLVSSNCEMDSCKKVSGTEQDYGARIRTGATPSIMLASARLARH